MSHIKKEEINMSELWELEQYEKNCEMIKPRCAEKGSVLWNVGSPFSVMNLIPVPNDPYYIYSSGIYLQTNNYFGVNIYIDDRFDTDFDIKFVVPFQRIDGNGGSIEWKMFVWGYNTLINEGYSGYNIENDVSVIMPYATSNQYYYQLEYILNSENVYVGDVIYFMLKLFTASRQMYISEINITYKKKRG